MTMKTFHFLRFRDTAGDNGNAKYTEDKEVVAEGVEFSSGVCIMHWLTDIASIAVYDSVDDLIQIHGHGGTGVVVFDE